ncbi:MAG: CBS protein [Magnetococcales bacterium]|nr:CBS protein [Magnetococcales bacterium]HIJ84016.1 CBS domain-containing protein [Magnetococcales bacterium]
MTHPLSRDGFVAPILTLRLGDLDLARPLILEGEISIGEATRQMSFRNVDCVLFRQQHRYGFLTSTHIRDALAMDQRSVDTPIVEIVSWKLVMVMPDESLLNAFHLMTKHGVQRLVIGQDGAVQGTLEVHELLAFLTHHASLTMQRIHQATSMVELAEAVKHQGRLVQTLISIGAKVRHVGWLIQELDRQVFQKAAFLLATAEFLQHVCILVLGSEGRGEQIMKTDQDNALLCDENVSEEEIQRFTQGFTAALLQLGYPPCPGRVMMDNPVWGGSLKAFQGRLRSWIANPTPANLLQIAICYDARAVVGQLDLFRGARHFFLDHLPNDQAFYAHFAMPVLAFKTPLGIFNRFIYEKNDKQCRIDLKKGGIFPIVHGVRSLALQQRLRDSNTALRIRGLIRLGVLEQSFGMDLLGAFDFISGLRAKVGLDPALGDDRHGNDLAPRSLERSERESLRDSLVQVDRFKRLIDHHFRLRQLQ